MQKNMSGVVFLFLPLQSDINVTKDDSNTPYVYAGVECKWQDLV